MLIGVSYFLKFAFDHQFDQTTGHIVVGLLAGVVIVVWSERFRSRGYRPVLLFADSRRRWHSLPLPLGGIPVYALIPSGVAFAMMLAVTMATAVMAWTQDAEILAAFALIGGFTTPLLLSGGQNREVALFSYVAMLDLGALALVILKPWRRLLIFELRRNLGALLGWYLSFYDDTQLQLTVGFATLFFAIFRRHRCWRVKATPKAGCGIRAALPRLGERSRLFPAKSTSCMRRSIAETPHGSPLFGRPSYVFLSRRTRATQPRKRLAQSIYYILRWPSDSSPSRFRYDSTPTGSR